MKYHVSYLVRDKEGAVKSEGFDMEDERLSPWYDIAVRAAMRVRDLVGPGKFVSRLTVEALA